VKIKYFKQNSINLEENRKICLPLIRYIIFVLLLTSCGKENVQDCWKGQDPELSTCTLKSTETQNIYIYSPEITIKIITVEVSLLKLHSVLEMKIWIYWSQSNSWIYFIYIYLYKNWKNLLVRTKFYWSWAGKLVLIVRTAVSVM
jgi:hypothetical protein